MTEFIARLLSTSESVNESSNSHEAKAESGGHGETVSHGEAKADGSDAHGATGEAGGHGDEHGGGHHELDFGSQVIISLILALLCG
jgi:hypothetical protein